MKWLFLTFLYLTISLDIRGQKKDSLQFWIQKADPSLLTSGKKANDKLAKKVRIRTAQLQRQYDKMKRYAFLNAHEVRGPLSRILGVTEVMEHNRFEISEEERLLFLESLRASALEMDKVLHKINQTLRQKK